MRYFREYTNWAEGVGLMKAGVPLYTANAVVAKNGEVCPLSPSDVYDPSEWDEGLMPSWSVFRLLELQDSMPETFLKYPMERMFARKNKTTSDSVVQDLVQHILMRAQLVTHPWARVQHPREPQGF